jgi:hypothetical protein
MAKVSLSESRRTERGKMRPSLQHKLEVRASAGLDWLTGNIERFSPLGRLDSNPDVKPFAELAILYERLWSVRNGALAGLLRPHLRRWRRFLVDHCEDRAFAELPRRLPSYGYAIMLPYLALRATGYRSSFHEESLRLSLGREFLFSVEVVPHRVLDREYFLWKSGVHSTEPAWSKLYANTVLAAAPDPLHVDKETAYAITHTLFYLSDWGRRIPAFEPTEAARVINLIDCLIVHYWRLKHWDLLGELLVNRRSMRTRNSRLEAGAAAAFISAWRREGYILGEGDEIGELKNAPPSETESIIFRECYHTTLVGVLYCTLALQRASSGL